MRRNQAGTTKRMLSSGKPCRERTLASGRRVVVRALPYVCPSHSARSRRLRPRSISGDPVTRRKAQPRGARTRHPGWLRSPGFDVTRRGVTSHVFGHRTRLTTRDRPPEAIVAKPRMSAHEARPVAASSPPDDEPTTIVRSEFVSGVDQTAQPVRS